MTNHPKTYLLKTATIFETHDSADQQFEWAQLNGSSLLGCSLSFFCGSLRIDLGGSALGDELCIGWVL